MVVMRSGGGGETGVPTSMPFKASLSPVGPDEGRVQWGEDVLDAFQLEHTLVPPPVLLGTDARSRSTLTWKVPSGLGRTSPWSTCS